MLTSEFFEENKELLISFALRKADAWNEMKKWVRDRRNEGFSKKLLYDAFCELHKLLQVHELTKHDEEIEESLADFADGFTSWGRNLLLSDEPPIR